MANLRWDLRPAAAFFAVEFAQLAIKYFELAVTHRHIVGLWMSEEDFFTHAIGHVVASQVMAALAGALICFAVVARSRRDRVKP